MEKNKINLILEEKISLGEYFQKLLLFNKPLEIRYSRKLYCKDFRRLIVENDLRDRMINNIIIKEKKIIIFLKEKPSKRYYFISNLIII